MPYSFTRSMCAPSSLELFVEMLVAAVDVVDAVDFGDAFGLQAGEHERRRGAQVAGHHGRAAQSLDALDDGGGAFDLDFRAHALQFRDVHVALRENVFGDDADAVVVESRAHICACMSVGNPG